MDTNPTPDSREQGKQSPLKKGPNEVDFNASATRTDEAIRREVLQVLSDHDVDASDLSILVTEGIVTLKGTIEDLGRKTQVDELLLEIPGVDHIHNELRIGSPETEGEGEQIRSDYSGNPVLRDGEENLTVHGANNGAVHRGTADESRPGVVTKVSPPRQKVPSAPRVRRTRS